MTGRRLYGKFAIRRGLEIMIFELPIYFLLHSLCWFFSGLFLIYVQKIPEVQGRMYLLNGRTKHLQEIVDNGLVHCKILSVVFQAKYVVNAEKISVSKNVNTF